MKIAVEIRCGKKQCGNSAGYCRFLSLTKYSAWKCALYKKTGLSKGKDKQAVRLPECLAAEIKEKA